jgi:hypothetical protein
MLLGYQWVGGHSIAVISSDFSWQLARKKRYKEFKKEVKKREETEKLKIRRRKDEEYVSV